MEHNEASTFEQKHVGSNEANQKTRTRFKGTTQRLPHAGARACAAHPPTNSVQDSLATRCFFFSPLLPPPCSPAPFKVSAVPTSLLNLSGCFLPGREGSRGRGKEYRKASFASACVGGSRLFDSGWEKRKRERLAGGGFREGERRGVKGGNGRLLRHGRCFSFRREGGGLEVSLWQQRALPLVSQARRASLESPFLCRSRSASLPSL